MLAPINRKAMLSSIQDGQGKSLTIALFKETNDGRSVYTPLWSLKDWKEVYLDYSDPTEYLPAIHLIGDWHHWKILARSWGLKDYINDWREEVKIKLKAEAIASLRKQAMGDKGTSAAKWLAEKGFDGKLPKMTQKEIEELPDAIVEHSKRMGVV